VAPAKTVTIDSLSADSGTAGDFVTNTASQTINATLSGALSAAAGGASAEELWGSVDGGTTWTNITSKVSGTTVTWNGVTLAAGTSSVRMAVRDAAGNVGTVASRAYTLDTTVATPSLALTSDTGANGSDG